MLEKPPSYNTETSDLPSTKALHFVEALSKGHTPRLVKLEGQPDRLYEIVDTSFLAFAGRHYTVKAIPVMISSTITYQTLEEQLLAGLLHNRTYTPEHLKSSKLKKIAPLKVSCLQICWNIEIVDGGTIDCSKPNILKTVLNKDSESLEVCHILEKMELNGWK